MHLPTRCYKHRGRAQQYDPDMTKLAHSYRYTRRQHPNLDTHPRNSAVAEAEHNKITQRWTRAAPGSPVQNLGEHVIPPKAPPPPYPSPSISSTPPPLPPTAHTRTLASTIVKARPKSWGERKNGSALSDEIGNQTRPNLLWQASKKFEAIHLVDTYFRRFLAFPSVPLAVGAEKRTASLDR